MVKALQDLLSKHNSVLFDGIDVRDTAITFKNVTKFEITEQFDPKTIHLSNLQELFMPVSNDNFDDWIYFSKKHTQLKKTGRILCRFKR